MQSGIYVLDGLVPIIDCLMPFSPRNPLKQRHTLNKDQKSTTHPRRSHWCSNGDLVGNCIKNYHLVNIVSSSKHPIFFPMKRPAPLLVLPPQAVPQIRGVRSALSQLRGLLVETPRVHGHRPVVMLCQGERLFLKGHGYG